jgi:hypothetical protein
MSRRLVAVLALLVFTQPVIGGVRGHSSMYVVGTETQPEGECWMPALP